MKRKPRKDPLHQFLELRKTLRLERASIRRRLARIENVLTPPLDTAPAAAPAPTPGPAISKTARRGKPSRAPGVPSLKAVVRQLTAAQPLTKAEIDARLKQMGRAFAKRSLDVALYDKSTFKRADGKFSPLS